MRPHVLGLDVARKMGWAYLDGCGRWCFGVVDPMRGRAVRGMAVAAKEAGCTVALLEDCYLGKNVRAFGTLKEYHGRVKQILEVVGLRWEVVLPQVWQSAYGIHGRRDDRKRASVVAARRLGAMVTDDNEADAVLIADFGSRGSGFGQGEIRGKGFGSRGTRRKLA